MFHTPDSESQSPAEEPEHNEWMDSRYLFDEEPLDSHKKMDRYTIG